MKIIIPMAGIGKRMRPHTLTTPKPLLPIAGKPIVFRLVEDIARVCDEPVEEVAYIIHPSFGKAIEESLIEVAQDLGAKGTIYYQQEALGTAHAILCAQASLQGKIVIAFADTLFKADFKLDSTKDGIIWVQQIDDPSAFGVVKLNEHSEIIEFVEKPKEFISDLAIIGIYYFRDGEYLKRELQYLLDNDIRDKGEYQLTNALENMKNQGTKFTTGQVTEWLDCGNKDATVFTNQRYLEYLKETKGLVAASVEIKNSVIIEPVFIGEKVIIENTVIGPHVSVGKNSVIKDSIIKNSIIQENTSIEYARLGDSMIGKFVKLEGSLQNLSLGDYNTASG